jgi:hypothetical protein
MFKNPAKKVQPLDKYQPNKQRSVSYKYMYLQNKQQEACFKQAQVLSDKFMGFFGGFTKCTE